MSDTRDTVKGTVQLTESGVRQTTELLGDAMTRTVDVVAAQMEEAVRAKLIELGWTPPGNSQTPESVTSKSGGITFQSGSETVQSVPLQNGLAPCFSCGGQPERDDRIQREEMSAREAQSCGLGYSGGGLSWTTYVIACKCGIRIEGNNDDLLVARWNRRDPYSEALARVAELETKLAEAEDCSRESMAMYHRARGRG